MFMGEGHYALYRATQEALNVSWKMHGHKPLPCIFIKKKATLV